jgi:hypothetical protein
MATQRRRNMGQDWAQCSGHEVVETSGRLLLRSGEKKNKIDSKLFNTEIIYLSGSGYHILTYIPEAAYLP